jgi:hypothetical protein
MNPVGQILTGDKGFRSAAFETELNTAGITLIRPSLKSERTAAPANNSSQLACTDGFGPLEGLLDPFTAPLRYLMSGMSGGCASNGSTVPCWTRRLTNAATSINFRRDQKFPASTQWSTGCAPTQHPNHTIAWPSPNVPAVEHAALCSSRL